MRNPKNLRINVTSRVEDIQPQEREQAEVSKKSPSASKKDKDVKNTESEIDEGNEKLTSVPLFKLFRYATKWETFLMIIGIICSIGSGLCVPSNIFIFGDLVGSMVKAEMMKEIIEIGINGTTNATENMMNSIMDTVTKFAMGNSIIGLVMLIFTYISVMLFNYTSQKQTFRVRTTYLRSILHQDISWYDVMQSGDVSSRLTEDIIKFEDGIGEKVVMFLHNVFAFLGCVGLAFYNGWELTLVCVVAFPIMVLILIGIAKATARMTRKEVEIYAIAGAIAEEVIASFRTVIAFGGQQSELERYKTNLQKTYKTNIKKGFLAGVGFGLVWFFIYASYALSFWYGVTLILKYRDLPLAEQTYTAETMVIVFFSVMMGSINMGASSPFMEAFGISKAAAANVFSIIERKPIIDSMSSEGLKPTDIEGVIEFKNVSFKYPSRKEVTVLENLSFTVNKGQTVALVGSSGCGKSTCIQLIQRFYDPSRGKILIGGYDLKELNPKWFRNNLGIVGQEPVLFDTTVAENIRYGNMNASTEQIVSAAKEANAHDFIMKLPNKYDTLVGERGAQISGGQKQRIAIARAIIRNPSILLLDEATSALDTGSEAKVQAALDMANQGRTTIIVAHRLTTIRGADKIIVLSNGKTVEEGTHDYLMSLNGHYYSLVTAQVSDFSETINEELRKINDNEKNDDDEDSVNVMSKNSNEDTCNSIKKVSIMKILELNQQEWPYILPACLTSIIVGCSMPLFAILFGDVIGILSGPDAEEVRSQINKYCAWFVAAGIVIGVSNFAQIFLFSISSECLTMRLRGLTFEAMLKQEVGWFDQPSNGTGALCSKLSTESAAVQGASGQRIGLTFQSISTIILSIILSIYYEWRLGLVGMSFIPFILVVTYLQGLLYANETFNYHQSLETSTKIAVDAVSNIRTVVGLGIEDNMYKSYLHAMEPSLKVAKRNTHYRGLVFGLARSIIYFAYATCMYYGGYLIKHSNLYYANVFKVSQALIMGTVMVANASAFAPNVQKGLLAASNIISLLERVPKVQDLKNAEEIAENSEGIVKYEDIKFEYPTRPGIRVLNGLNLLVSSGKTIALIGSSGCGKSTLIQLLERFYDPFSGVVKFADKNIATVKQASLRMQLGLVSQEPTLFARTIAENIAYGDNTRQVPLTEIIDAAKKANIHHFIASLPLGYETKLGDRGTQLSGGQKQRIAIARALIRNPQILLLDEATSALDTESEKIVQAALDEAKEGRTCILIAHRLSTVENADKICVINSGVIAECGTHKELIEKKGFYYELLCLQNARR
ncbi:ATP-dependent translocase ABCB1 [Leptopilina boulardi]|uniref:ATP-dependent translocase ABCB1 n=1 Tax=Leptopilina boulardi TaxID=63433 RepID=UPI0021F5F974|nr:ATP-dependent translocase ABCB1 [Leptopilina boulardi]XP_051171699.1 ATP-dependent translocase ABCB1 [Leptopilina boulardi]XP_051171700.1 ATP-dependent translocase ABCB1 [Leptopilina boulardi]